MGVLGTEPRPPEHARDLRDERLACAAEGDDGHVAAELVLLRGLGDRVGDASRGAREDAAGGLLGVAPQHTPERCERGERRLPVPGGVRVVVHAAERVRGARRRERERAAGAADDRIGLRVAGSRRDELHRRALELLDRGEAGVPQAGHVRTPRPDRRELAALEPRHAPPGGADDPAVDRADARRPAHHAKRPQHRPPALDHRDVGARAAALDHDPVVDPELVQRGGDAGGRPGADRERRPPPELVGAHRAAVAAEDEERHVEPGPFERRRDEARRALDDGEDARVDRRAHRPRFEAVGPVSSCPAQTGSPTRSRAPRRTSRAPGRRRRRRH